MAFGSEKNLLDGIVSWKARRRPLRKPSPRQSPGWMRQSFSIHYKVDPASTPEKKNHPLAWSCKNIRRAKIKKSQWQPNFVNNMGEKRIKEGGRASGKRCHISPQGTWILQAAQRNADECERERSRGRRKFYAKKREMPGDSRLVREERRRERNLRTTFQATERPGDWKTEPGCSGMASRAQPGSSDRVELARVEPPDESNIRGHRLCRRVKSRMARVICFSHTCVQKVADEQAKQPTPLSALLLLPRGDLFQPFRAGLRRSPHVFGLRPAQIFHCKGWRHMLVLVFL